MKIGFLFPGQGSQTLGMGKDLYEKYDKVKQVYDKVNQITGINIKEISFNGPEEELNKTQNTQLEIKNIKSDMSAGLSLGEYTALIDDNIFDFETGVNLVKQRGLIMQEFTPKGNWKMAAILGLNENEVEDICKGIKDGYVIPANYNTKGQVVISGEEEAVLKAGELAKENGAKKVSILNTAGPFHTEKLRECSKKLKKELENIKSNTKNSKVVKNINGKLYTQNDDIVQILSEHICNPVKFTSCLQTMYDNGIDTFIEIGPGKTLSSFVKRMKFEKPIKIMNINHVENLEEVIKEVKTNE